MISTFIQGHKKLKLTGIMRISTTRQVACSGVKLVLPARIIKAAPAFGAVPEAHDRITAPHAVHPAESDALEGRLAYVV